jgi:hypothetical protein
MARRPAVALKDEHKAFLVQRLAVFDTPKEATEALKVEFGIAISAQRAESYDPNKRAGQRLSMRWKDVFQATRKRFLDQLDDIPSANKAVRVRRLERMALGAEQRGNFSLAAALLKQIAEEVGNVYTNRREYMGKDGGPIETRDVSLLTDDELDAERERVKRLLAEQFGFGGVPPTAKPN